MAFGRPRSWLVALAVAVSVAGRAQQDANAPSATGIVAGYIYCADTDKPARFARVTIEPVEDFDALKTDAKGNIVRTRGPSTMVVQTKNDGSYSIDQVPVGAYYIVAELPGYLSPLTEFTLDDLSSPDEESEKRFRAVLRQIAVTNGQTTRADIRLERGAVIAGKVLYDDGSVAANAYVRLFRIEKDGTRKPVSGLAQRRFSGATKTDDRGHYRIAMLVAVDLRMYGTMTAFGEVLSGGYEYAMPDLPNSTRVYYGDTTKMSEAKPVKVRGDDERSDVDITVPLSRFYTVSGTVVATSDGHAVNTAKVALQDTSDGTTIQELRTQGSGRFTMENVPDGRYLLKITEANDGVLETGTSDGGHVTYTRWVAKHRYADTEVPLEVHKDVSGVAVKVNDLPAEDASESAKTDH